LCRNPSNGYAALARHCYHDPLPTRGGADKQMDHDMNDDTNDVTQADDDILAFEVSDETLEATADMTTYPAVSFPNAPTVSILVACCSQ
jgi:hypothetical protein